ncbi:6-phosphogluconate dehydrogenase [Burkholderia lata]|uniref:DUF1932 domain-containing protein n=1 Tax=Burkholderia lata (strain ATCC 17760 / DSM 23089 / LMG 22485 / NCIMB 9086 / R18194 / 383) TaxID=482957 RepID=UPI00145476A3|nr:DUF1932 domain-containing protein [Burkholderia lata]VWD12198.1 6-phosphogluconate dehydrogenase [Burkholderia lata]
MNDSTIAFIGFGEAGSLLGGALAARSVRVATYDRLLDDAHTAPAIRNRAERLNVRAAPTLPGYPISRVAEHGRRRAAEMREVCETLREGGIAPEMSAACARVQDRFVDRMAERGLDYDPLLPFDWAQTLNLLDGRTT